MWLIWSTCSDPLLMGLNYIWWVLDKFCRITSLCPIIKLLGVVVVSWIIHKASHLLIFRYLFSSFVFFGFFCIFWVNWLQGSSCRGDLHTKTTLVSYNLLYLEITFRTTSWVPIYLFIFSLVLQIQCSVSLCSLD